MIRSRWYITGTSRGLGHAIAMHVLQRPDAEVHGFARHNTIVHSRYQHHTVDLTDAAAVSAIDLHVPDTIEEVILINNAGALGDIQFVGRQRSENIRSTYQLNIITPHILCNAFISALEHRPLRKVIINVTSGAAKTPYAGWSMYCGSKAALDMFTLCLANEQMTAQFPCLVYAIAPGVMDTDMQTQIRQAEASQFPSQKKFADLYENHQLYHVQAVAEKYVQFADTCTGSESTVQRFIL